MTTRQRFGIEGPSASGTDAPHWDGLRVGELRIQRCTACERWIWGAQPICPDCHTFDPAWVAVPAEGAVYSWTRTWQRFHPTAEVPYVTVLVELTHAGGRHMFGLWTGAGDPVAGQPVRGVFEAAPDGGADGVDADSSWPLIRWEPV